MVVFDCGQKRQSLAPFLDEPEKQSWPRAGRQLDHLIGARDQRRQSGQLFQRAIDGGEFGVQLRAHAVHDADDGKRNASGDQTVFDRSGALFIPQKFQEQSHEIPLTSVQASSGSKRGILSRPAVFRGAELIDT
jgi:hypothetical protein